jgi:hypothetical protein
MPDPNGTNLSGVWDVGRPSLLPSCRENSRRDACSTPLKLVPFMPDPFAPALGSHPWVRNSAYANV